MMQLRIRLQMRLLLLLFCLSCITSIQVPGANPNEEEQTTTEEEKCTWGDASCSSAESATTSTASSTASNAAGTKDPSDHQPLFVTKSATTHEPPTGFTINARVFTSDKDKLAHFDTTPLTLPYFDCASAGLTSAGIKVTEAFVRNSFTASPEFYQGPEFDHHATLLITLTEIIMDLNSGESKHLQAGSVVLLEDVVAGGHKLKAVNPNAGEVTVILLTLPKSVGAMSDMFSCHALVQQSSTQKVQTRRAILTGIGMVASVVFADFLGKVAPIWLSIGIGGMTVIVGGTYSFVKGAESLWNHIELRRFEALLKENGKLDDDADDDDLDELVIPTVEP